jgi:hypothetical protein
MRKETLTLSLRLRLSRDLFPHAAPHRTSTSAPETLISLLSTGRVIACEVQPCDDPCNVAGLAAGLGACCRASLHAFGPFAVGFGAC